MRCDVKCRGFCCDERSGRAGGSRVGVRVDEDAERNEGEGE